MEKKTDDMVKANLGALTEDFDCTGASLGALVIRQDKIQHFIVGTSGTFTDEWWRILQTTHVIESSGILTTKWYSSGKTRLQPTKPRQDSSRTSTNITRTIYPCSSTQQLRLHTCK